MVRNVTILTIILFLSIGTQIFADENIIPDNEASKYIGEAVSVKGFVANVFQSQKGNIFLNFGKPYPNQTFAAVIFNKDTSKFNNIKGYEGKIVVVTGTVQLYKGHPEIIINSPGQIKIAK
jgi:DNA/RNA endonuclease YhcR with UshA esterase domain